MSFITEYLCSGSHGGNGGRNRKISASSNDTENAYGGITRQSSSVSRGVQINILLLFIIS